MSWLYSNRNWRARVWRSVAITKVGVGKGREKTVWDRGRRGKGESEKDGGERDSSIIK